MPHIGKRRGCRRREGGSCLSPPWGAGLLQWERRKGRRSTAVRDGSSTCRQILHRLDQRHCTAGSRANRCQPVAFVYPSETQADRHGVRYWVILTLCGSQEPSDRARIVCHNPGSRRREAILCHARRLSRGRGWGRQRLVSSELFLRKELSCTLQAFHTLFVVKIREGMAVKNHKMEHRGIYRLELIAVRQGCPM